MYDFSNLVQEAIESTLLRILCSALGYSDEALRICSYHRTGSPLLN